MILESILPSRRVSEWEPYHPSLCLLVVGADFAASHLVGKIYLERAKSLVKGEKDEMIWNKTNALRFLDNARGRAQGLDSIAVGLVARDYEAALYLTWSGTEGG